MAAWPPSMRPWQLCKAAAHGPPSLDPADAAPFIHHARSSLHLLIRTTRATAPPPRHAGARLCQGSQRLAASPLYLKLLLVRPQPSPARRHHKQQHHHRRSGSSSALSSGSHRRLLLRRPGPLRRCVQESEDSLCRCRPLSGGSGPGGSAAEGVGPHAHTQQGGSSQRGGRTSRLR